MSVDPRTGVEVATQLTDFSASRLGVISKCGLAFDYAYIRQLPRPFDRAATLFGTVVHNGVEDWYGPDDDPRDHQARDLAPLVLAQWENVLPPVIWNGIQEMRDLDAECKAVAAAILFKRPELKSPETTKEFLESAASKAFKQAEAEMLELSDKLPDVKWNKTETPYKAYVKSAAIAKRMQERWQPLPRPLAVEWPFAVEIGGFRIRGRIDQLRADVNRRTGEANIRLRDIKTGTQPLTQMEAIVQAFIYYKAVEQAEHLPTTTSFDFYLARHDKYQDGVIDPVRHERLVSRILNGRARQIAMGQFEPSYGMWCKTCDFADLCSSEIALWEGDGMTAEVL